MVPFRPLLPLAAAVLGTTALLLAGPARAQATSAGTPAVTVLPAVRPEMAAPLNKAQAAAAARNFAEAAAAVREAEALPDITEDERFLINRAKLVAALGGGEIPTASQAADALRGSGRLQPAERQQISAAVASAAFRQRAYPEASRWARIHLKDDGGSDPQMRTLLANALYLTPDYPAAGAVLLDEVQATESAGQAPTEERLRMLASAWAQAKDDEQYEQALRRLVARYPKRDYWVDLIQRVGTRPGFNDGLLLDQYRLLHAAAGLRTEAQYLQMAQLAMTAGYPIEARKVLEEGFAKGVLGQGAQAARAKQLRENARREAASDEKRLADGSLRSTNTKDGNGAVAFGLSYVLGGFADKGLAMMEEGLQRGGLKRPDDARLRLGMAYLVAGQKDKAAQMLASVKGSDGSGELARLWELYLKAPPATS